MNAAHVHLILTHFPIGGIVLVTLLAAFALLRKSDSVMQVALAGFVVVALLTIPLYLTGEEAEEQIEDLPGVVEATIEKHEQAALPALIGIEVVGVLAMVALAMHRTGGVSSSPLARLVVVLAFVSCILVARSANFGGQIRHPEINDAQPPGEQQEHK